MSAKEIVFFAAARHNVFVIGAFLNALGILAGGLFGLTQRQPLSARAQDFFKSILGLGAILTGLYLLWISINGTFFSGLKQFFIAALAVVFGNLVGKIFQLQKISNRIGRHAGSLIASAQKKPPGKSSDGFVTATLLFCATPLGILGAVTDGLNNFFYPFLLKAVMDGLATVSFVKIFRWPAALAAVPVAVFFNGLALACHFYAAPFLDSHHWTDSVNATAGLIICTTSLVIFQIRRVELANYLPALALAPLFTRCLN